MIGELIDGDFVDFCIKNQIIVNTLKMLEVELEDFAIMTGKITMYS